MLQKFQPTKKSSKNKKIMEGNRLMQFAYRSLSIYLSLLYGHINNTTSATSQLMKLPANSAFLLLNPTLTGATNGAARSVAPERDLAGTVPGAAVAVVVSVHVRAALPVAAAGAHPVVVVGRLVQVRNAAVLHRVVVVLQRRGLLHHRHHRGRRRGRRGCHGRRRRRRRRGRGGARRLGERDGGRADVVGGAERGGVDGEQGGRVGEVEACGAATERERGDVVGAGRGLRAGEGAEPDAGLLVGLAHLADPPPRGAAPAHAAVHRVARLPELGPPRRPLRRRRRHCRVPALAIVVPAAAGVVGHAAVVVVLVHGTRRGGI
ncbi:hypothetical protein D1007_40407 [Hordeum vulgare]|nr:hypothetical protein D1007_40407 [Hordeum vulgare]